LGNEVPEKDGMQEVSGSIPLSSTKKINHLQKTACWAVFCV
jgi:hypothetical protein